MTLIVSFLETQVEGLHITDTTILIIRKQILRDKDYLAGIHTL